MEVNKEVTTSEANPRVALEGTKEAVTTDHRVALDSKAVIWADNKAASEDSKVVILVDNKEVASLTKVEWVEVVKEEDLMINKVVDLVAKVGRVVEDFRSSVEEI